MIFHLTAKKLISYDSEKSSDNLRESFVAFIQGLISFPLDIPGTAYHQCMQVSHNLSLPLPPSLPPSLSLKNQGCKIIILVSPMFTLGIYNWWFFLFDQTGKKEGNEDVDKYVEWKTGKPKKAQHWFLWLCPGRTREKEYNSHGSYCSGFNVCATLCQFWDNFLGTNLSNKTTCGPPIGTKSTNGEKKKNFSTKSSLYLPRSCTS